MVAPNLARRSTFVGLFMITLATAIALGAGISMSFWSGFTCYAGAFLALLWITPRRGPAEVAK